MALPVTSGQKALFNWLVDQVGDALPAHKIRPHALQIYGKFTNKDSKVNFDFKNGNPGDSTNPLPQVLLTENDIMVVSHIGLMVQKAKKISGRVYPGNARLVSYPDATIFNGAAVAPGVLTEAQNLEAFYNGKLTLKTGNYSRIQEFPASYFRVTPETQQGTATEPSIPGLVTRELVTSYFVSGKQSNKITIDFPAGAETDIIEGTATGVNYPILVAYGFLIVDGAQSPELLQMATIKE